MHQNFEIPGWCFFIVHIVHELDEDSSLTELQHKLKERSEASRTLKTRIIWPRAVRQTRAVGCD